MSRDRRPLRGALVACAVAAVVGVGAGGALALWSDTATVTARMPVGVMVFGAGAPGAPVYATSDAPLGDGRNRGSVPFTFGPAQAAALYASNSPAGGAVAIPVQVDTLAQGHRGLGYVLSLSVTGGIFGASNLVTYPVASAAACTTALTGPGASSSTPWPATYSASTTVLTEYWCLVARYVPTRWAHTNTATATAPNPLVPAAPLQLQDSWSATAQRTFDPAAEPTHTLTFTFTSFRPGGAP